MRLKERIVSLILAFVMVVSMGCVSIPMTVQAEENGNGFTLEDGVYAITGSMVKVDKTTASMSDRAINHTIKLTVTNGTCEISMNFNGMSISSLFGYLSTLKYFQTGYTEDKYGTPQGTLSDVTVENYQTNADGTKLSDSFGTDYPEQIKFELIPEAIPEAAEGQTYVPLQVFVPIMEAIQTGNGTQQVYLKLDWDSLRKTTEEDEAFKTTVSMGSAAAQLRKSAKYVVPVSLKNANNITADSTAKACLGAYGELTLAEDGTATLQVSLRNVKMGNLTGYAEQVKVYQGTTTASEKADVTVLSEQTANAAGGTEEQTVPKDICFVIPKETLSMDGVFINMYIGVMGYAPDAYIQIDYDKARLSGDLSLNYVTEKGTAYVEQFGKYYVDAVVTVADGKISDVEVEGRDFNGTYAVTNESILTKAAEGMKEKFSGLYDTDQDKIGEIDGVSGATISSNAVRAAVMDALGMESQEEVIPDTPDAVPAAGTYRITIKNKTDIVDHSLVENEKADAILRVDNNGKMTLSYQMVSGNQKEPMYVLGYNGYYKNNDMSDDSNLTMENVIYRTESCDTYTVVTDVQMPLSGLDKYYYQNVYLYVPAMKNLNGMMSGIMFEAGKFNIKSTITLYWDTLTKVEEADKSQLQTLCTKAAEIDRSLYAADSLGALDTALEAAKTVLFDVEAADSQVQAQVTALNNAIKGLKKTKEEPVKEPETPKAPAAPGSVKATASAYNKVKISWKKVSGANGYEIYQYNSKTKKYAKAAVIKNGSATSYTISGLTTRTTYKFKVCAYCTVNGKNVYSSYSKAVSAKPALSKVTGVKAKNSKAKTAKITWKKVTGASGYTVYRAAKKNGKYTAVKTISKGKTVSFTNKKLKKGKTYYYKVKAYRKVGSKKVYGGASSVVSVKIKK